MKNNEDASFNMLVDMCKKVGWDKGIKALEKIVIANENTQAYLFSGDYNDHKKAQKLSKTIIQQNITIGRLKHYRKENKL